MTILLITTIVTLTLGRYAIKKGQELETKKKSNEKTNI